MRTLQRYYKKGLIEYPRTESNYINSNRLFSYRPHPPLKILNPFFEPLKKEKYEFNKQTMFLHFHNIRAITPSNYERVKKQLKAVLIREDKKDYIKKTIENYDSFLDMHQKESRRYFLDYLLKHYKDGSFIYNNKSIDLKKYRNINELYKDIKNRYNKIKEDRKFKKEKSQKSERLLTIKG